ncbi:MAG: hypothetical protein KDD40_06500 [Bdellovibrionales bacterium]|nr:hypothetical protein [Bdellovibrionales bacterium]
MKFKRLWLCLCIILLVDHVYAESLRAIGIGFSSRIEEDADQKYLTVYKDNSLFGQWQSKNPYWHYLIDLHSIRKSSHEGNLSVNYERYDLNTSLLWDVNPQNNWHWYVGGGLGLSQGFITTEITNYDKSKDTGDLVYNLNAQVGVFKTFFAVCFSQFAI